MYGLRLVSLAALALQALLVYGQDAASEPAVDKDAESGSAQPQVAPAVTVSTTFPSASEIFGVKLVNGLPTEALLTFTNEEEGPVLVSLIGGSLWTIEGPDSPSRNVRNLTTLPVGVDIAPGAQETVPFKFATEMHPQELSLNLLAVISDNKGNIFTMNAYNQPVSIVEPDTSIFDPQILFLYVFLLASFVGVSYFFYTVWIAPYFPQKRKGATFGERGRKTARHDGEASAAATSPETPVASAKTYDTEWIPAHHIQPPQARKVKGSKSKPRA